MEMELVYWCTSSGRIGLELDRSDAISCSHPGPCDDDVAALAREPYIVAQTEKINPALLRDALREYGAWEAEHLADHDQNIRRLLWLAAGDIADGQCDPEEMT